MTTKISSDNIQTATLETLGGSPTITNVYITDSSYTVLDDTAVALGGGYVKITGTKFASGCSVVIDKTPATAVTFISSTEIRAQIPAMVAGTYVVYVINPDGSVAIRVNGLTFSSTPTWSTGSTLPVSPSEVAISIQLVAAGATTYTVQAGSTIPTGLTLAANGLLTGTITGITSETTYNFTVNATDAENQDSPRAFSITITAGDLYWNYTSSLLSPATLVAPFLDDASANNLGITVVGDSIPSKFNPTSPGYYSGYFDGTGDYLYTPNSPAAFNFSTTKTMTFECWVNADSWGSTYVCFLDIVEGQPFRFVYLNSSTSIQWQNSAGTLLSATVTLATGTWHHLAFVRNTDTLYIFVNGVQVATGTYSADWPSTPAGFVFVGCNRGNTWFVNGHLADVRLVKGYALYTANFTPPTEPLAAITGTSLLVCRSNRFIDASPNNFPITRNGDTKVRSFVPYAPASAHSSYGSVYLDGSGDYLTTSGTPINFGTGDFTIEWWVYRVTAYASDRDELPMGGVGGTSFMLGMQSGGLQFGVSGTSWNIVSSITIPLGVWAHCAIARVGSTVTMYIDGAVAGSTSLSTNFTGATAFDIGRRQGSAVNAIQVYCSNLRVVNGTSVYTAAFTPPSAPLTAVTNTSLLTFQTNQPIHNNIFLDSSTNNLLIARNGNATQGTLSPYGENWSNYFDGTGDYLVVSNATAFDQDVDFTVEMWLNISSFPTSNDAKVYQPNGAGSLAIAISTTGKINIDDQQTGNRIISALTLSRGVWYHIALVRNGPTTNNLTLYIDGVADTTVSYTNWQFSPTQVTIGIRTDTSTGYNGYISNLRVVKGTAVYSTNFTPSTTPLQPIAGTVLLTCKDSSIVDDSLNRFTITRTGDVSSRKYGPFAGTTLPTPYYSAYFDGSGDRITVPASANYLFSGDFTIEGWMNFTNTATASPQVLFSIKSGATEFDLRWNATRWQMSLNAGSGTDFGTTAPANNTWTHVAAVRSGSTIKLYVNGVATGVTLTNSTALGQNAQVFCIAGSSTASNQFAGYIADVRVINGTALYTANFTPPTAPVSQVSNTVLMLCRESTFIDSSTNAVTVTAVGDSRPTTHSPYTASYSLKQSYTPALYSGSMYFDGTGDYLTIPSNAAFTFAGDFTIEAWVYPTVINTNNTIISRWAATAVFQFKIVTAGRPYFAWYIGATGTVTGTTTAVVFNQWNHVAVTRSGTTVRLFVNGIQDSTTGTATGAFNNLASAITVGAVDTTGAEPFTGNISDVRVINGTALYTSNFVPSNTPLTPIRNSALLLNGTSAGIYDSSGTNNIETIGDVKLSTTVTKYGNSSMYFDGTGDYLKMPRGPELTIGAGDITYEFWLYRATNGESCIYSDRPGANQSGFLFGITGTNKVFILASLDGVSWSINTYAATQGNSVPSGQWSFIAISRQGANWRVFIDGVLSYTSTLSGAPAQSSTAFIGYDPGGQTPLNGYLSDFRITKGVARYTANFTPLTSTLPTK